MTKIKGLIIWLREAKFEVWDTLPPITRNRIVGAFYAFEGAGYAAAVSAMVNWPTPSLKTIFTTSAVTGFIAVRNYLKQPNRDVKIQDVKDLAMAEVAIQKSRRQQIRETRDRR